MIILMLAVIIFGLRMMIMPIVIMMVSTMSIGGWSAAAADHPKTGLLTFFLLFSS